jgi:hypothetical protein
MHWGEGARRRRWHQCQPLEVPIDPHSGKKQTYIKVVYQVANSLAKIFGLGDIQHGILRDSITQIAPLGWEHISFNGDYVWPANRSSRDFGRCEIHAPSYSMPLSVRFETDSAMTPSKWNRVAFPAAVTHNGVDPTEVTGRFWR